METTKSTILGILVGFGMVSYHIKLNSLYLLGLDPAYFFSLFILIIFPVSLLRIPRTPVIGGESIYGIFLALFIILNTIKTNELNFSVYTLTFPAVYYFLLLSILVQVPMEKSIEILFKIAILSVSLEFIYMLLQQQRIITNSNYLHIIGGAFGHPGYTMHLVSLTTLVLVCIPTLFLKNRNRVLALYFICLSLSVYFTSRTSIIICLICIFPIIENCRSTSFWPVPKKYLFSGIVVLIIFLFYKPQSTSGRLSVWKQSVLLANESPLLGHGLGSFEYFFNWHQSRNVLKHSTSLDPDRVDHIQIAYSDFIEIWVEGGIVTVAVYLSFWVLLLLEVCNEKGIGSKAGFKFHYLLVGFLVVISTWTVYKDPPYTILFATLLAYHRAGTHLISK